MEKALALVFEADWALRQLMRRALEAAGFDALDSGSFVELDLKLRLRALRTSPRALLVLGDTISSRAEPAIRVLTAQRAAGGLASPQVMLTRELGSAAEAPSALGDCTVVATLEKPFDLAWFQAVAFRCRTAADETLAALGGRGAGPRN